MKLEIKILIFAIENAHTSEYLAKTKTLDDAIKIIENKYGMKLTFPLPSEKKQLTYKIPKLKKINNGVRKNNFDKEILL
jgi:hypothetical protein